jgi:hypothetical protein
VNRSTQEERRAARAKRAVAYAARDAAKYDGPEIGWSDLTLAERERVKAMPCWGGRAWPFERYGYRRERAGGMSVRDYDALADVFFVEAER